jgi:predicted TIM-barrel fold metal-dependent hydrolase
MKVIDAHMHVLDRAWVPTSMREAWARQGAGRRLPEREVVEVEPRVMLGQSDPTAELTIAAFDRCNVAAGVVPVVDWTYMGRPDPSDISIRELLEHYEQLALRWPGRLLYCAGVDPRHGDALEILEDAISAPACVGIKLYPAAGWSITEERHRWVFDVAEREELPLVVHTASLGGDPLIAQNSRPAEVARAIATKPMLTWVLAHSGFEAWWAEACDIASGWRRVYLDLSLWQAVADRSYGEFRSRVALLLERVGAHRILFGSDIIRGMRNDPDGSILEGWIDRFLALT